MVAFLATWQVKTLWSKSLLFSGGANLSSKKEATGRKQVPGHTLAILS